MSRNFRAAGETGVAGTVDSATLLANGGFLVTGAKHAGGPLNSRETFRTSAFCWRAAVRALLSRSLEIR